MHMCVLVHMHVVGGVSVYMGVCAHAFLCMYICVDSHSHMCCNRARVRVRVRVYLSLFIHMLHQPLSEIDVLREQWREVFILAAEIYVFGAIIFTVLASGEVQSWAKTTKRIPLSTANGVIGINDDIESVDHSLRVPE